MHQKIVVLHFNRILLLPRYISHIRYICHICYMKLQALQSAY